jgi:hypothetical protein
MAMSKALQNRQWWAEAGNLRKARWLAEPTWFNRDHSPGITCNDKVRNGHTRSDYTLSQEFDHEPLRFTFHAQLRMAQRNLSDEDIYNVLLYGETWYKAGAIIMYLRRKDIPLARRSDQRWQRLIGATVVVTCKGEQVVLTAYRNRRFGLHQIKRKPDYGWN